MSETTQFDWSKFFLIFFAFCFLVIMAIGLVALKTYNVNAPEPKPGGGAHGGMILPQDGQYAPHVGLRTLA